jgi:hypothetical protein
LGGSLAFWVGSTSGGGGELFFDTTILTCATKPSNGMNLCCQLVTSFPLGVHGVTTPLI